jgi:hypothetical protein
MSDDKTPLTKPRPAEIARADRIRAIRLWLHRRLDELLDQVTDPAFSGSIELSIG